MAADTDAERQANFRARMRRDGWLYISFWVHRDDKEAIKRLADEKRSERSKITEREARNG